MATIKIDGREYDTDDLTLDEVETVEDLCDSALDEIDWRRAKAIKAMVFVLKRRDNPDVTLDDIGAIRVVDLVEKDEEEGDSPPPPAAGGVTSGDGEAG